MTRWRAIIPLKMGPDAKSRLASILDDVARAHLVRSMASHVIETVGRVCDVAILAPNRPDFDGVEWIEDQGRGLNGELSRLLDPAPMLIIHADLPQLAQADILALTDAAIQNDIALAPDRLGTGTNALALFEPIKINLCFGPGSFAKHHAQYPMAAIVRREGLAHDIDTPEDLTHYQHRQQDMRRTG